MGGTVATLDVRTRQVWRARRWYLAPLWPGLALFLAGIAIERGGTPRAAAMLGVVAAVVVGVNLAIAWANQRAAGRLARELASLPPVDRGDDPVA